jgi:hypothetical protein
MKGGPNLAPCPSRNRNETVFFPSRNRLETCPVQLWLVFEGDFEMIAFKFVALVVGAGVLVSMFSPEFDADLLLAIIACFT